MRIIEVTTEAVDPIGANTAVENHIEVLSRGEGDKKIIIEANIKVTADNLIPLAEAIIITIMAIIEAKVAVAVAVVKTITDLTVMEEVIIKAIIITNTINITHMMMDHSLNNMAHHVHFVVVLIILLNIALMENTTSIISWRKLSLGTSNQHQNGLYQ